MNKEKLQEIASTMTKDEFIKKYHYNNSDCPGKYGLKESNEICNGSGNCTKCWEEAIYKLKFKEDNMKELNIIEASKMEVGTKFKVIKDGKEKKYTLLEDTEGKFFSLGIKGNSWSIAYSSLIQAKFIPLPKEIEADFMEAIKAYSEGKTIICKIENNKTEFKPQELFTNDNPILDEFEDGVTAKEILEGKWYIIND